MFIHVSLVRNYHTSTSKRL